MASKQEVVLSVPDVSCEHCVKTINLGLLLLSRSFFLCYTGLDTDEKA
jgi:hypothetical protein